MFKCTQNYALETKIMIKNIAKYMHSEYNFRNTLLWEDASQLN